MWAKRKIWREKWKFGRCTDTIIIDVFYGAFVCVRGRKKCRLVKNIMEAKTAPSHMNQGSWFTFSNAFLIDILANCVLTTGDECSHFHATQTWRWHKSYKESQIDLISISIPSEWWMIWGEMQKKKFELEFFRAFFQVQNSTNEAFLELALSENKNANLLIFSPIFLFLCPLCQFNVWVRLDSCLACH